MSRKRRKEITGTLLMMKQTPVYSSMKNLASCTAVGYFLLLTPAIGFSCRTTHREIPGIAFVTDDRSKTLIDVVPRKPMISTSENERISSSRRRSIIRGVLPVASLFASAIISNPLAASAGIDVSGLRVEGTPQLSSPPPPKPRSSDGVIELAGVQYTPAAMILQMAEQTASMEGMMRASASDMQGKKSRKERVEAGSQGRGPGVVSRNDLTQSVGVMVRNSKVATIAPKAAITLQTIPDYLSNKSPTTDMSFDEYLTVANKYNDAREDLRIAFENMPQEDQEEGRQIVRAIRRRDMERMAVMQRQR